MTKDQKQNFNKRLLFFKAFLVLSAALISLRLFIISVVGHSYYKAVAENQHDFSKTLQPSRGKIFIADKFSDIPYPVATNALKDLVYADPQEIQNPASTAKMLAKLLALDEKDVLGKISDKEKRYVVLMHQLSDDQSTAVQNANIPGIHTDQETVRFYPEGDFLSQVLGFVGYKDNSDVKVGLYGLEKFMEKTLAGSSGSLKTETDLMGNWITASDRQFTPAEDGSNLVLTIDRSIQYEAEKVLKNAVQTHGADSGNVIILDPKTGAVLAMANYPSFDPNNFSDKAKTPGVYLNDATQQSFEPGSTMKAVTMAAGLDLGVIAPSTTYNDTGEVDIGKYKIRNSDNKAHGIVDMTQVIDHSLNTGAIFIEEQVGNDKFLEYLKKFGFGKATNVELPEAVGDLSPLHQNNQASFYTASYGQGITVTPMQMLQAYLPFANGGEMLQPHIIASEIKPDGTENKTDVKSLGQVVSGRVAQQVTAMLVDDVENGYGKQAGVKGYYIAGKTGTAQVAEKGSYVQNDNIGSFVGYGPADNPRFLMLVKIDHPRDVAFAESTAAPAFGEIAKFILNYYRVPPTR